MKTTVDIPDALFEEARETAKLQNTTLKALLVEGLRAAINNRKKPEKFRLRDESFGGEGLTPEFRDATWEQIRDMTYEGRGG